MKGDNKLANQTQHMILFHTNDAAQIQQVAPIAHNET